MNNNIQWKLLSAYFFFCATNAVAQEECARGIEFGMELTSEMQVTHRGDYNYANLLHLSASLPVSRNITFEAASISTCMTAAESIGGDLQTFSNLDAGCIPFALSVCGVSWQVKDQHALFAGVRNMNEDYFTSSVTSFFTNSSCGIFPTIGANYPIANYPVASVGVHYCYDGDPVKVQASVYNGTGYNRFTGGENVFRVCPQSDGVFGIAQVEYQHKGGGYFLGNAMYYNDDLGFTPWFYTEQKITPAVSIIAGYSHAFARNAECKDFVGLGLYYQLRRCELGIFTDYARFSDSGEWATELTCKYTVNRHVQLQPVAHVIMVGSKVLYAADFRVQVAFD